jgi:hypothetical protein
VDRVVADAARQLRGDLAPYGNVVVRIPGWQPSDLADGLVWANSMANEGWLVDWLIDASDTEATVWLRHYEAGDPPPDWDTVKATEVKPSRDPDGWADDPTYQGMWQAQRDWILAATSAYVP